METMECILTRRSIRNYSDNPIPEEKLQKVLDAIRWAPSWVNLQPWEVVIVDDPAVKEELQTAVPEANPGRKAVTMAPLLLVMIGRKGVSGMYNKQAATMYGDWVMFDMGIACQNLCLAAWDQGLGTLHLGLLDHQKANKILGVPEDMTVFEIIPLGVPAKEGKAPPRKKIEEFVHNNRFGNK